MLAFLIWTGLFLPQSYFFCSVLIGVLLAFSFIRERNPKLVVIQLFLIFLMLNNIYGLATNFKVLPYGDAYWEYAVVETFKQESTVSMIPSTSYPASKLTWYSGWPLLHTLSFVFYEISGLSTFQTLIIIPLIFGITTFIILLAFFERLRKTLNLKHEIVLFGLLVFVASPDSIFWRTDFVRQNMGLLILFSLFLTTCLLTSVLNQRRKIVVLILTLIISLVFCHHLTSFTVMLYFFLLFGLSIFTNFLFTRRVINKFSLSTKNLIGRVYLFFGLLTLALIFLYWDNVVGVVIYPVAKSRIDRFWQILLGIRETSFFVPQATYPSQLTPSWALYLLNIRDIALYLPALIGFFLILKKNTEVFAKQFILLSTVSLALYFFVNNLTFRLEPYRLIAMSLPFIAVLSAIAYSKIKCLRVLSKLVYPLVAIIIIASFIGLWGHNFAPIHLYDLSINRLEIGENISHSSMSTFVNNKISYENLDLLWTDDLSSLILLLVKPPFEKIRDVSPSLFDQLGASGNEIFFVLRDLYLYEYHAGVYSPISIPNESAVFRVSLKEKLSTFNLVYTEGRFEIYKLY
ncbi:MAG: hypothetical protein QW279_09035 [Candidatus Jordarchaeaceae archaeon]